MIHQTVRTLGTLLELPGSGIETQGLALVTHSSHLLINLDGSVANETFLARNGPGTSRDPLTSEDKVKLFSQSASFSLSPMGDALQNNTRTVPGFLFWSAGYLSHPLVMVKLASFLPFFPAIRFLTKDKWIDSFQALSELGRTIYMALDQGLEADQERTDLSPHFEDLLYQMVNVNSSEDEEEGEGERSPTDKHDDDDEGVYVNATASAPR